MYFPYWQLSKIKTLVEKDNNLKEVEKKLILDNLNEAIYETVIENLLKN